MLETCWRKYCFSFGDDYSFKECPSIFQNMAFCLMKDAILRYKKIPLTCLSGVSGNRK